MKTENQNTDFINFRNYYTGKMSPEEKVVFEENIESDPFAKEAFEGFLILENDFERISAIENTNIYIKEKYGIQDGIKKITLKQSLAIAASLLIFIGVFSIIKSNVFTKNETLASNVEKIEQDKKDVSIKEIKTNKYIPSDSLLVISDEEIIQKGVETLVKESFDYKNVERKKEKKEILPVVEATKYIPELEEIVSAEQTFTSENIQIKKTYTQQQPVATNTVYFNDKDLAEDKATIEILTNYKKGIVAYNLSEYNKAIKFFTHSISNKKSISSSNFYTAMSYFNQNKNTKAIKYFDKVIISSSSLKDKAKWYKALSLIRKGQKNEAKFLLHQISKSTSIFKQNAAKKLLTL